MPVFLFALNLTSLGIPQSYFTFRAKFTRSLGPPAVDSSFQRQLCDGQLSLEDGIVFRIQYLVLLGDLLPIFDQYQFEQSLLPKVTLLEIEPGIFSVSVVMSCHWITIFSPKYMLLCVACNRSK